MQARSYPLPDKEIFWLRILRGPKARAERAPAIIHRLMTSPIFARPMTRPEFNENQLVFDDFFENLPPRTRRERYARGAAEGYAASAPAAQAPFERRQR